MTVTLFLIFLALMATVVVALIARYLGPRASYRVLAGLSLWFLYVGLLGYFGVVRNTVRPPGLVFIAVPVLALLAVFFFATRSSAVALAFPLWILLGLQSFRIGVELFLHQLWTDGLIPKTLTFEGANVDMFIGVSAPIVAWLSSRGRTGIRLALAWSMLGLLSLANVVTRSVLTAPGPLNLIHAEVPNRLMGSFPFLFVPGFFVPLAVVLHILAIRVITAYDKAPHIP
jgi:hypothetical protein